MKKIFFLLGLVSGAFRMQAQNWPLTDIALPRNEADFRIADTLRTYDAIYPSEQAVWGEQVPNTHIIHTSSRLADRLLNKPLWEVARKDYGFRLSPLLWLEAGKTNDSTGSTFINTRGIRVEGYVGRQVAFHTEIYENQARFPDYFYRLYTSRRTGNGFPAVVPGMGIAKQDRNGVLDFPSVRGHVTYRPSKFFLFRIGHGTPFMGYGYRSLFLGDDTPPYPYFRVESRFWHLRYTVSWAVLQDVRLTTPASGVFHDKYMAVHLIDWAVVPRVNIGLFENVIWDPSLGRGFDVNFLNPVIFFKTVEFQSGTKTANTVMGMQLRYKSPLKTHFYTQFLLDEMTVSKFFAGNGYWGNKYAWQAGIKTMQHIGRHRIFGQVEYNFVRPFTYSHHRVRINYSHDNWPLAHPRGANFREWLVRLHWSYGRWQMRFLWNYGIRGMDKPGDPKTYGGDIFRDYEDRYANYGVRTGGGNRLTQQILKWEGLFTLNPYYRLQIFGGWMMRHTHIDQAYTFYHNGTFTWFYGGLRTELFAYKRDY